MQRTVGLCERNGKRRRHAHYRHHDRLVHAERKATATRPRWLAACAPSAPMLANPSVQSISGKLTLDTSLYRSDLAIEMKALLHLSEYTYRDEPRALSSYAFGS
jgi:hypothetical protein